MRAGLFILFLSQSLPSPFISVHPPSRRVSLGGNATIYCKTPANPFRVPGSAFSSLNFHLEKDGPPEIMSAKAHHGMVSFRITNVRREYGGTYTCYCSSDMARSNRSESLELLIIDPELCKPQISLKPNRMAVLRSNTTIQCWVKDLIKCPGKKRFYLHKVESAMAVNPRLMEPDGDEATTRIVRVNWSDGGSYYCSYRPQSEVYVSSEASDNMELLVLYPDLPRPNIYLSPSRITVLGSNITIQCWVKGSSKMFFLHKAGDQMKPQSRKPDGDMAVFTINNVGRDDGGTYACSYRPELFISSETSPYVEMLVLDPSIPRPNIFLSPTEGVTLGRNITIHCQSHDSAWRVYLLMAGQQIPHRLMEATGAMTNFSITNVSWESGGKYSCSYSLKSEPFILSELSDPLEVLIVDPNLPRPNISLSLPKMPLLGSNATIQCRVRGSSEMFYLHKVGEQMKPQLVKPYGDIAVFPFNNVGQDDGGKYRCSYRPESGPFISSETSSDVDMMVVDPSLPRPVISISPSGLVVSGEQVNIRCEIQDGPATFYLHKAEDPTLVWPMKADFDVGEHSINNVSLKHQGNYSCSYSFDERCFLHSSHSDPQELLVSEAPDYVWINITRFALGSLLLTFLACSVTVDQHFQSKQGP